MAKPRVYGMQTTGSKKATRMQSFLWEKAQRRQRNREKAQRVLTGKEKEAQA